MDALFDHLNLARNDDFFVDVFDESLHKRCTNTLNPLLQPDIIVEVLSLGSQYTQLYSEVIVRTVHYFYQTVFYLLCDVKYSREIQDLVVWSAELTNATDHQLLVIIPQLLEDGDRVSVSAKEHGQEN